MGVVRVISGAQTGADQGALAAAIALNLKMGGHVPKGWRTEEGPKPWLESLGLKEHGSEGYRGRTIANVESADATLWLGDPLSPGGKLTLRTADSINKPSYVVDWRAGWPFPSDDVQDVKDWLDRLGVQVLNVAGNRSSKQPGIFEMTKRFLTEVLT